MITVKALGIQNPLTMAPSSNFAILTFVDIGDQEFVPVEMSMEAGSVKADTPNTIQDVTITRDGAVFSLATTLEICITPTNPVPDQSTISIVFPRGEVKIDNKVEQ